MIANVNRKSGSSAIKPDDFVPRFVAPGAKNDDAKQVRAEFLEAFGEKSVVTKENANGDE